MLDFSPLTAMSTFLTPKTIPESNLMCFTSPQHRKKCKTGLWNVETRYSVVGLNRFVGLFSGNTSFWPTKSYRPSVGGFTGWLTSSEHHISGVSRTCVLLGMDQRTQGSHTHPWSARTTRIPGRGYLMANYSRCIKYRKWSNNLYHVYIVSRQTQS